MADCTRRRDALWSACRCPACTTTRRHVRKLDAAGLIPDHRDQAWDVLRRLRDTGGLAIDITRHTRLGIRQVHDWWQDIDTRSIRMRRPAATAVAALDVDSMRPRHMWAHGATRRLQGLACHGWGLRDVADHTGIPVTTLAAIRRGEIRQTVSDITDPIRVAADRLDGQRAPRAGGTQAAIAHASRSGWLPLSAWDDIDDPGERPDVAVLAPRQRTRADVIEDAVWLLATGTPVAVVARRIGVTDRYLRHVLSKAAQLDQQVARVWREVAA